jgi:nucleoside-diphosphate-sugar epimerase
MTTYLVTGGGGFIGSHLAEALVRKGFRVRILDNFLTGKKENLASVIRDVELIEGDIRDLDVCRQAALGVDHVLHQAALPSVPRSVQDPRLTNDINITGTLNMLLASRDAEARSFVFASSSSVYGDTPELPKTEGKESQPLSPYAASKLAGEKYCQVFSRLFGLRTVALRYFNVFGPRQDPLSQYAAVIPLFITRILRGEAPKIFGDGEQSRDFTYVDNVVEANILASKAEALSGAVMNVACGLPMTVNGLAARIGAILGSDIKPVYEGARSGDIRHSFADISLAGKSMGFSPLVPLDEGLARTIEWYRRR